MSKQYDVDVERDGKVWLVHVPAVNRSTQARNLPEVDLMARDLIAIMLDVAPDSFDLDVSVKVPPKVLAHVEESQRLRTASLEANARAAAEFRAAVRELVQVEGLTVRDVGSLFKISHQRVHQLLHDGPAAAEAAPARKQPVKVGKGRPAGRLISVSATTGRVSGGGRAAKAPKVAAAARKGKGF